MKRYLYITLGLVGLFLILQSFIQYSMSSIEKHKYTVIKKYDDFEIRDYEAALFSSVVLDASTYDNSANKGFRILAGYIFGGNENGEKIAMTSPVAMELGDSTKMSFMVPSNYNEGNLPKPTNEKIFFEKKNGSRMAAIRFGGWANDKRIEKYRLRLIEALKREGIQHNGNFAYLGYNPPYALIGRRNEIVVELVNAE
jgi:hypothetical protein